MFQSWLLALEMAVSERAYCSQQHPEEPLAGTAPTVDVWLLLEYRPAWQARATRDNELAAWVRDWLTEAVHALEAVGHRPRLQFVRQPELDMPQTRLLIGARDALVELSGEGYGFLRDVDPLAVASEPHDFPTLGAPRYFVCTNGQRDVCCARFGLRTYAALREHAGARVWQVTHLGGHRFAPNVLVLPTGLMYGRVDEGAVPEFVRRVEEGVVDFAHLRGRSRYPPHVQSAEAAAARDGLKLLHVDGNEAQATVTFGDAHESTRVSVRRRAQPLLVNASCGEPEEPVYPYEVV